MSDARARRGSLPAEEVPSISSSSAAPPPWRQVLDHAFGPEPLEIEMVDISSWSGSPWPESRGDVGRFGEELAAGLAEDLGLKVLSRNWRCSFGELDLVAAGPEGTLRFVEVRTRSGDEFGSPAESVTRSKAARLRRLASAWLAERVRGAGIPETVHSSTPAEVPAIGQPPNFYGRLCFDVVSVRRSGPDAASITWIWEAV